MIYWLEATMDKAAHFYEVTQRNALRQMNGLPLLDVPAEYAHQVLVAKHREYQAICDDHADEREATRQQVLARALIVPKRVLNSRNLSAPTLTLQRLR